MDKLILKQPSEKLRKKLEGIVTHIRNCATLVDEVIALGKEEGFSEKQIGRMIREKLKQLGYDSRSIRRALPLSIKDLSKTRKDYLHRSDDNSNDNMDEDKMSSSENSNDSLKDQLTQKQTEIEDLSIQCKNATQIHTELRGQLQTMREGVRTLILPRDKFPSDCDQVFKLHNYVFLDNLHFS
jgi:hypothetical protein